MKRQHTYKSSHRFNREEWRHQFDPVSVAMMGGGLAQSTYNTYQANQAQKRQEQSMREEAPRAQAAAERIRQGYQKYVQNAGFAPGQREQRLSDIRSRLGQNLAQGRYQMGQEMGRRNLGRTSLAVQSGTRLAQAMGQKYGDIEYGLEQQDRAAKQRARLQALGAEPGLYQMAAAPRMGMADFYKQQYNQGMAGATAGAQTFGSGMSNLYSKKPPGVSGANTKSIV